jgi:hypothetical protein
VQRREAQVGWTTLPEATAARHPLHGIAGWLLAVFALALVALVRAAVAASETMAFADGLDPLSADLATVAAAAGIGLRLVFPVLALGRHPATPAAAVASLWAGLALDAGLLAAGLAGPGGLVALAATVALAPPVTLYLLRSRRVNVTFRNRVRTDDPILA